MGIFEKVFASVLFMTLLMPQALLAAGGGEASKIVIVADARGLSGWQAWMANLYNESLVYFTIFTVIAIPLTGLILGLLADMLMRCIGLDLKSRKLAEH
jgi:hypothetical protein